MSYLDNTGLAYFWSKIKAWCNAAFAAAVHSHAGSQVVLTGYSKPSSGSAVSALDTANQAIGKLEAKVDAVDDSNVVHRTGTEVIDGEKTFKGVYDRTDTVSGILIRHPKLSRGDSLSSIYYWQIALCDKDGAEWANAGAHGRCGNLLLTYDTQGNSDVRISVHKNTAKSTVSTSLVAGILSDGTTYATAPQTSTSRTDRSDIVTRGFLLDRFSSISAGDLEFQNSATLDNSGNVKLNITNHRSIVTVGNTNNYPYHRIAYIPTYSASWSDRGITFLISRDFYGGGWGICRIILRTNDVSNGQLAACSVQWLVRSNELPADAIQAGLCNTSGASYVDVFYKASATYSSAICRVLAHSDVRNGVGRGFTVIGASTEVNGTTASNPLTSVESYASINAAASALHSKAYDLTLTASDIGVVGTALACTGNAATATKLGTSTVGSASNPIYLNAGVPTATGWTLAKAIQLGVSNNSYSDIVQTLQSDNNNYRSCTIRCYNGSGFNELFLGAHDESNNAPAGLAIRNTNGSVTADFYGIVSYIDGSVAPIRLKASGVVYNVKPSTDQYKGYYFEDANGNIIARLMYYKNTSGGVGITIGVKKHATTNLDTYDASFGIACSSDGTSWVDGITPAANSNSTAVATTAWVRTFCDTTQKYMKAVSVTGSGNAVTTASLSNGTLTLTKGSTFSLSSHTHSYLPLSGGNMTGNIVYDTTNTVGIRKNNSTSLLEISGGSALNKGSRLALYGESHATYAGRFDLIAGATSTSRSLVGTSNGNITWNGAVIQTSSDARLKTELSNVPDAVLDAWEDVRWGQFKMLDAVEEKGEENARLHVGLIAQQAKASFEARGLDGCAYGILCYENDAFDDLWMVRYAEALCMEAAYVRRENARLKKRVSDLEDRLAALEMKLS